MLTVGVQETVDDAGTRAAVLGTLRRGDGGPARFAAALAEAHVRGTTVDWAAFHDDAGPRRIALPTYPFQRRRYWPASPPEHAAPTTGADPAESGFWSAVEDADLGAVS